MNTFVLLKEHFAWLENAVHLKWSERSNKCVMRGKHYGETEKTKYLGIAVAKPALFFGSKIRSCQNVAEV